MVLCLGLLSNGFAKLAAEVLDERKLGAADPEGLHHFNVGDVGRGDRVDLLDAITVALFADGEGLRSTCAADAEDHALKHLDTFALFALRVDVLNFFVDTDDHARLDIDHREM